ncbi:MAG: PilZ domain-containing protein [Planctomycetes bacterium]|nr:PilZ domain-containing protein [Planctomycetota bacterium]
MVGIETSIAERRQYPRTQLNLPVQVIRLDPDGEDLVEQIEMLDISRGGIGAMCSKMFYPGQRLVLSLPARGMGVRRVCGIIQRCTKQQDRFHLGIQFAHPLASLCADAPVESGLAVAA